MRYVRKRQSIVSDKSHFLKQVDIKPEQNVVDMKIGKDSRPGMGHGFGGEGYQRLQYRSRDHTAHNT